MRKLMILSLLGVSCGLCLFGCSSGGGGAVDRDEWKLVFTRDGSDVVMPLEHMLVYVVEDENEYPEVYEITGDGVTLVGTFPMDLHVGYDERWDLLFGSTIEIDASGGARDDLISFIQMPDGSKAFVSGGTLAPEKLEGKMEGLEGDKTLSGTFTLKVRTAHGEEAISGRFAVHCVTLG